MQTQAMFLKSMQPYDCNIKPPILIYDGQEAQDYTDKASKAPVAEEAVENISLGNSDLQQQTQLTNDIISHAQQQCSTATTTRTFERELYDDSNAESAVKKHCPANRGDYATPMDLNRATAVTSHSNEVEKLNTAVLNLAPPPAIFTPTFWSNLFTSRNSNDATSGSTNGQIEASSSSSSSICCNTITTGSNTKPIAKVAPYEAMTPVLSSSVVSSQNLPPPAPAPATATNIETNSCSELQLKSNSVNLAEFLTNYKTDWTPISLRPRGLRNRLNYCYINSTMQALLGCSPLYNLIGSISKPAASFATAKTPAINAMMTFMSKFSNLPADSVSRLCETKAATKGNKKCDLQCDFAFEATEIYKLWNNSHKDRIEGRQEDAEEFLSYILNKLNDEMLEVMQSNTDHMGTDDSAPHLTDFAGTPLSDIFRGELRSRLQREDEHPTDVIQPFFTLQLNMEKAASVKEALKIFAGREQLEGVTSSNSQQEVVAWQQMNLEKLPPVLILHLKCFRYHRVGSTKIIKKFEFPLNLKIDEDILASKTYSRKQRCYRLFAVVYHVGRHATNGHYITDVFHTGHGSWLRYDDHYVKPVSETHVLSPPGSTVPYLLYYRRRDTIPKQQKSDNENSSPRGEQ